MGDPLYYYPDCHYVGDSGIDDCEDSSGSDDVLEERKVKKAEPESNEATNYGYLSLPSSSGLNLNKCKRSDSSSESSEEDTSMKVKVDQDDELVRDISKKKRKRKKKERASTSKDGEIDNFNINLVDENSDEHKDDELFPVIKDVLDRREVEVERQLPEWLANPSIIEIDVHGTEEVVSEIAFLDYTTRMNLETAGITHLFPVQAAVIPWLLQSNTKRFFVRPSDLCVSAPTGSGKTLAFVIPIVQSLKYRVTPAIRALVVLPVGTLAIQVFNVFEKFCRGTELKVGLVIGQKSFGQEQSSLLKHVTNGQLSLVDILIATPGRLIDHIAQTEGFTLKNLQFLVIDEADRMMDEIQKGFLKKIDAAIYDAKVNSSCSCYSDEHLYCKTALGPSSVCGFRDICQPMQKLLYSATLSQDPEKLHELSLYRPKLFTSLVQKDTSQDESAPTSSAGNFIGMYTTPKDLREQFVVCETSVKPLVVCHLLTERKYRKVVCFTHNKEDTHRLNLVLSGVLQSTVRELSSQLSPIQRKITLKQFAAGKAGVLVCTDMFARGMDIAGIDCVIIYNMPKHIKAYVHRIGRTARAGKKGTAITLLAQDEVQRFNKMLNSGGKEPALKINVEKSDLVPFEEPFKQALSTAQEIIKLDKQRNNPKLKRRNNLKLKNRFQRFQTRKNFKNRFQMHKNFKNTFQAHKQYTEKVDKA